MPMGCLICCSVERKLAQFRGTPSPICHMVRALNATLQANTGSQVPPDAMEVHGQTKVRQGLKVRAVQDNGQWTMDARNHFFLRCQPLCASRFFLFYSLKSRLLPLHFFSLERLDQFPGPKRSTLNFVPAPLRSESFDTRKTTISGPLLLRGFAFIPCPKCSSLQKAT